MLMTQDLPFADKTVQALLDRFERVVYAADSVAGRDPVHAPGAGSCRDVGFVDFRRILRDDFHARPEPLPPGLAEVA
jgi:hypothetical protein